MLEELKEIVAEHLGIDDVMLITPEASFVDDLGADSLNLVELIMAIEEKFRISIPDEDAEKLRTVQHAIDYLEGKGVI